MDILKEENFSYDSSLFSGSTGRTKLNKTDEEILALGNGLKIFPISTFKMGKFDFGTGGAYFRLLPYKYFKRRISSLLLKGNVNFYIHPWELDPDQPKVKGSSTRINLTHYINLNRTEKKLENLVSDFDFCTLQQTIN